MTSLLKAAKFARLAHAGHKRAHGAPYFGHPRAVAKSLWKAGYRGATISAAYLHDTVEDCGVTFETLETLFGAEVTRLVRAVTKAKAETHEEAYRRIKAAGPEAIALKRADRAHNNSELHLAPPEATALREKAARKTALLEKIFSE